MAAARGRRGGSVSEDNCVKSKKRAVAAGFNAMLATPGPTQSVCL